MQNKKEMIIKNNKITGKSLINSDNSKKGRKIDGKSYAIFENVRANDAVNITNNINRGKNSSTGNFTLINSKIFLVFSLFIILAIFLISLISAFSVSAPYMENREWKLYPGASENLKFVLQNGGATEPSDVKVIVTEGNDLVKLADPDKIYTIPVGGRTEVDLKVEIQKNASLGETHKVTVGFSTAIKSPQGAFTFGSTIDQPFTIIIGEKSVEKKQGIPASNFFNTTAYVIYIIIGIIIIIAAIVFWIIRKRKQK